MVTGAPYSGSGTTVVPLLSPLPLPLDAAVVAPLDEDMLITGVTFRRSRRDGTTTTLTLVPRGALSLLPTEAA